MEERLAKIISYIFHPIFLPLYSLILLFDLKSCFSFELIFKARLMLMAFVAITTIVFPLSIILLMKHQGFIHSFQMDERKERKFPYLITAIFYLLTYNMFRQLQLPNIYTFYMMGATLLIIIVVIINLWWKISTHMIGIGGVFGLITALAINLSLNLFFQIIVIALVAGIIGYARLKLNSHKPLEIYAGFLAGAFVMLCVFYFI